MNESLFPICCSFTLTEEGGYCNVKGDPGGATNHGVTIGELSTVLGRQATVQDVQALTVAQAQAIYKPRYWGAVSGDMLPPGVNLCVFDFGVNAGPETSAKRLQSLLGVTADGDIGKVTLAALAGHAANWVISTLTYSHISYYRSLPGWDEFGAGWEARARRCQDAALGMLPAYA